MSPKTLLSLLAASIVAGAITACGTILGLPGDTNADPNFGLGEGGSQPDVSPFPDGFVPEGGPLPDTSNLPDVTILPDGACNCFGGTCNGGVCQPIAVVVGQPSPNLIDTDNTSVFFASNISTIFAFDIASIDAGVRTVASAQPAIYDVRASAGWVYFTNHTGTTNNSVARCKNCSLDRVNYAKTTQKAYGVAVDGTNVFYTVDDSSSAGGVYECSMLSAGCSNGGTQIQQSPNPQSIVINGSNYAWWDTGGVHQCPIPNGPCKATLQNAIADIASAPTGDIYYLTGSEVWDWTPGKPAIQIAGGSNVSAAFQIRADATYVYWLNGMGSTSGSLVRCPIGTNCLSLPQKAETLVTNLQDPAGLALSNDSVYYTTTLDTKVWRLKK